MSELESYFKQYPVFTTDISYTLEIIDNTTKEKKKNDDDGKKVSSSSSSTSSRRRRREIKFPALHPMNPHWNNFWA